MKLKFPICILLLHVAITLSAQRFSENTELYQLNKYATDFDLRILSNNERQHMVNEIVEYVRSYTAPFKSKFIHQVSPLATSNFYWREYRLWEDPADSIHDLQRVRLLFFEMCEEAKRKIKEKIRPGNDNTKLMLGKLVNYLHLPSNTKAQEIESCIAKIRNHDTLMNVYSLLGNYYYGKSWFNTDDHVSYERAVYYLHKLIILNVNDIRTQRDYINTLRNLAWSNERNFHDEEHELALAIKSYQISKVLKDRRFISNEKNAIFLTLCRLRDHASRSFSLSESDFYLLNDACMNQLYLNIKSRNSDKRTIFEVLPYFLKQISGSEYSYVKEIEKCEMIRGLYACRDNNQESLLAVLTEYMTGFGVERDLVQFENDLAYLTETTKLYSEIADIAYMSYSLRNLYSKLRSYYSMYSFLKAYNRARLVNGDSTEYKQRYNLLLRTAIDSVLAINARIDQWPRFILVNQEWYETKYRFVAEIWQEISQRDAFKMLKSTDYYNKANYLWRYHALLKAELKASKDEVARIKDDSLSEKNIALKSSNAKLVIANDSLDSEIKRNEILSYTLNKEKVQRVAILLSSAILVLILVGIVTYTQRRRVQERKRLEKLHKELQDKNVHLRNKAAMSLLSSHTLKNSLNASLYNYIVEHDQPELKRYSYSHIVKRFFSSFHENLSRDEIAINEELDFIQVYCGLFESKQVILHIQNSLSRSSSCRIPSLLTLSLIENSITKGFRRKASENVIMIELSQADGLSFEISITDNGIGKTEYLQHKANLLKHLTVNPQSGTGLSLIHERIALFNELNRHNPTISFEEKEITHSDDTIFGFETGHINKLKFTYYEHSNS